MVGVRLAPFCIPDFLIILELMRSSSIDYNFMSKSKVKNISKLFIFIHPAVYIVNVVVKSLAHQPSLATNRKKDAKISMKL